MKTRNANKAAAAAAANKENAPPHRPAAVKTRQSSKAASTVCKKSNPLSSLLQKRSVNIPVPKQGNKKPAPVPLSEPPQNS